MLHRLGSQYFSTASPRRHRLRKNQRTGKGFLLIFRHTSLAAPRSTSVQRRLAASSDEILAQKPVMQEILKAPCLQGRGQKPARCRRMKRRTAGREPKTAKRRLISPKKVCKTAKKTCNALQILIKYYFARLRAKRSERIAKRAFPRFMAGTDHSRCR